MAAAFGLTLSVVSVYAQTASASADSGPYRTSNPTLRASLDRITKGSALWRDASAAVESIGRHVLILTSDQVRVAEHPEASTKDTFDATILAEVAPVVAAGAQVDVVLVVINLALLEDAHWKRGSVLAEFAADLDRILVHEIYGHAVPYLLAGGLSGRCPDPIPGERVLEACSIQRENAVRAELGLGRRSEYGLGGLALARRDRR
jgi:hypothetical protein